MKWINYIGLVVLLGLLASCELAKADEYYTQQNEQTEDTYLLSGIEFQLFQGGNMSEEIDVSEYFYVSFACPGQTVFDDCVGVDVGQSIESSGVNILIEDHIINDEKQPTVTSTTIDLTFYALEESNLWLYSQFVFVNEQGEIIKEQQHGVNFANGMTLSGEVDKTRSDGSIDRLNYTFHYVTIDPLEQLRIKQFDQDDQFLKETIVSKEDIMSELILEEETAYYFIIEEYIDKDGVAYQNRIYNDGSIDEYYLYKFTNDDGFLLGDRLLITSIE